MIKHGSLIYRPTTRLNPLDKVVVIETALLHTKGQSLAQNLS